MLKRTRLDHYLRELYEYKNFEDFCYNGLQVEGSDGISKIAFGVTLNDLLIERAVQKDVDALIVHHGFFGKAFLSIQNRKKRMIEQLILNGISLFGIHLPMDAHPDIGHNALLFNALEATPEMEFDHGFIGKNRTKQSLDEMMKRLSDFLLMKDRIAFRFESPFNVFMENGFIKVINGPTIPDRIAIISGGAARSFEKAIDLGVDTFFCGEIKEDIPSLAYDRCCNFINLTHHNSEKPGLLKLAEKIRQELSVDTEFIDLPNPV